MRPLNKYIVVASLCLPALLLHAQHKHAAPPPSPATIKATADKQKIVIGEPIHVHLQVTIPDNIPFAWPGLVDSIPHFEWLDKGRIDTIVRPGERSYEQYLTVTSFDSGTWAIPPLAFLAGNKKAFSDSIRIDVGYTALDSLKDYHDIKDIIDIPNPFARWIGWIVAAVTLVSAVLVVWFVRKRKALKKLFIKETPRLSPYEEAIRTLDELAKKQPADAVAMKAWYSSLSEVLRTYLLRRMDLYSFAETSEELIGDLRQKKLLDDDDLSDALRMGDFVKFAKYQPSLADSQQHYRAVREAIERLERSLTPPPVPQTTPTTKTTQTN